MESHHPVKKLLFETIPLWGLLILLGVLSSAYFRDILLVSVLFGLFAAAVNVSWGLCGIINMGSALYFGTGAYFAAYALKNDLSAFAFVVGAAVICSLLCACVGWVAFRRKTSAIHFGVITLALALAAQQLAIGLYDVAGGSNGIANIPKPVFSIFGNVSEFTLSLFYYCFAVTVAVLILGVLLLLKYSDIGKVMICVRDTPERAEAYGISTVRVKVFSLALTGFVSCVAGALYVPVIGIAHPSLLGVVPSMLVLVWIALGGLGRILGSFYAAICIKLLESELGVQSHDLYTLMIGVVFVVAVIFVPDGVAPYFSRLAKIRKSK